MGDLGEDFMECRQHEKDCEDEPKRARPKTRKARRPRDLGHYNCVRESDGRRIVDATLGRWMTDRQTKQVIAWLQKALAWQREQ